MKKENGKKEQKWERIVIGERECPVQCWHLHACKKTILHVQIYIYQVSQIMGGGSIETTILPGIQCAYSW